MASGFHVSLSATSPPRVTSIASHAAGSVCYHARCHRLPSNCKRLVLLVEGRGLLLDPLEYYTTSAEGGGRVAWAWDALMRHSCDPNTERVMVEDDDGEEEEEGGGVAYVCRARRAIGEGEEMTVDVEQLRSVVGGGGRVAGVQSGSEDDGLMLVRCHCGCSNCRQTIKR